MSYGRPSKAERERWAELLGDEGRRARRMRVRIGAIVLIVLLVGGTAWAARTVGLSGSCPSTQELRETWAEDAGSVTDAERDAAIEDTIRCVDLTTRTREQIQADLGDWTSVKEYRPATKGGRASFLVWSNGDRTDGVRIDFASDGRARSAQRYRAPAKRSGASG